MRFPLHNLPAPYLWRNGANVVFILAPAVKFQPGHGSGTGRRRHGVAPLFPAPGKLCLCLRPVTRRQIG